MKPEALRRMRTREDVLLAAGTILTVEQARKAVDAGADFLVTPAWNPEVVQYCLEGKIPVIPGTSTPTDLQAATTAGIDVVKFFPAEAFGGLKTLKAISAPFGTMRFVPTGGIGPKNLKDYLSFSKVIACGGSWMVHPDLIRARDFKQVTKLTREAVDLAN